jgi:parvulin-like peptidyl-prolyl isomerase
MNKPAIPDHFYNLFRIISLTITCGIITISAAVALPYDKIRVTILNRAITQNEIKIRTDETLRSLKKKAVSKQELELLQKQILKQLIDENLLDLYGEELSISISPEQLDSSIEEFRTKRKLSQHNFEELLEQQNISLVQFKRDYVRNLRQKKLLAREVHSKIKIDLEKLEQEYSKNRKGIHEVHALHILLRLDKEGTPEQEKKVLEKIRSIKKELLQGKEFQELALQYSEDPSVKNNRGDLGFFQKSSMVKEFSAVAFKLSVGEISEPVKTVFGYHLIKVIGERDTEAKPFTQSKDKIYQQEYQKRYLKLYDELLSSLRKKYNVVEK